MDQDLEDLVARASDPRWVPGIYNYCDRRCARCRLNDRCFSFSEDLKERTHRGDALGAATASLEQAFRLLAAAAERDDLDLDDLTAEADDETDGTDALASDPLVGLARGYSLQTWKLLHPLDSEEFRRTASPDVRDAVGSLLWLSSSISAKIFRALHGLQPVLPDEHPTQNDAHGSAKIARLMIAESAAAWRVVNGEGQAPADSPTRAAAALLDEVDAELARRVPRAMEFVRPGFDEDVPGTVTAWSLTPAEDEEDADPPTPGLFVSAAALASRVRHAANRLWPSRVGGR